MGTVFSGFNILLKERLFNSKKLNHPFAAFFEISVWEANKHNLHLESVSNTPVYIMGSQCAGFNLTKSTDFLFLLRLSMLSVLSYGFGKGIMLPFIDPLLHTKNMHLSGRIFDLQTEAKTVLNKAIDGLVWRQNSAIPRLL